MDLWKNAKNWGGWKHLGRLSLALAALFMILVYGSRTSVAQILDGLPLWLKIAWSTFVSISLIVSVVSLPQPTWDFLGKWGAWLSLVLLFLPFFYLSRAPIRGSPPTQLASGGTLTSELSTSMAAGFILFAVLLAPMGLWFLQVFATPLPQQDPTAAPTEETRNAVARMVRFSYWFTLFALAIGAIPLLLVVVIETQPVAEFYKAMVKSPIGFVRGCLLDGESSWELSCQSSSTGTGNQNQGSTDREKVQWFINIGGSAKFLPNDSNDSAGLFQPVTVFGGLAVPWYFITLALMGGAVSMARRVPEYQRKALDDKNFPDFTPAVAREYLVFQVLQVFTAPLIAITAYNLVTPGSRATSVAIAFVSGFASETVLVTIRAFADKLEPADAKKDAESGQKTEPETEPNPPTPPNLRLRA